MPYVFSFLVTSRSAASRRLPVAGRKGHSFAGFPTGNWLLTTDIRFSVCAGRDRLIVVFRSRSITGAVRGSCVRAMRTSVRSVVAVVAGADRAGPFCGPPERAS